MRAIPLLAPAFLSLAVLLPAPAGAGTFHVYGLGLNGAHCPNGWKAHTLKPRKFKRADRCGRWEIRTSRDGTPLRKGDFAGTSMFTGEGARFTGLSIRSRGVARNGMFWKVAACAARFARCQTHARRRGEMTDTESAFGSARRRSPPLNARHLFVGVTCGRRRCADSRSAGRAAHVTHSRSHAVVEDYTPPPAPSLSGVSTGWSSGPQRLAYAVSDPGSGIQSVTLTIDGSLHRTNTHACTRLSAGGYRTSIPCMQRTSGKFALNQPGQLADGRHTLSVTARDAGGERSSTAQEFWLDNHAPTHPLHPTLAGGDGWRAANDFALTWESPHQGDGSPIAAAYYKIGAPPTSATDGTRVAGGSAIGGVQVPGDGDWGVYVWLADAAGNADATNAAEAHLRLDTTAPALAFATQRDAHNPAEVRAATSDAHSGVADGAIAIRRRGTADWHDLETRREGTDLVATVPDERLPRGTYELRASAWDAVGNGAATGLRSDGQEMLLDLPLRGGTRVSARLARGRGGARPARRTLRVRYRRTAWLRGVLRTGAGGLPDTRVAVEARRLGGGRWRPLKEVVTDARGRYALRLPKGSSRRLRVRFPGNPSLRPAEGAARLIVRGSAKLRLRPRRLRRGGTITFRGRVGHFAAALPRAGKLIQIQYLDGRRWRPAVRLGRTDARGRFAIRYRFRRISRPTRIYFRILVPAEGGWPYATGASRVRTAAVAP